MHASCSLAAFRRPSLLVVLCRCSWTTPCKAVHEAGRIDALPSGRSFTASCFFMYFACIFYFIVASPRRRCIPRAGSCMAPAPAWGGGVTHPYPLPSHNMCMHACMHVACHGIMMAWRAIPTLCMGPPPGVDRHRRFALTSRMTWSLHRRERELSCRHKQGGAWSTTAASHACALCCLCTLIDPAHS